jgi:phosphoribosylamine--glycine ligase
MKVLVVGNGGREHAIAWKLKQSSQLSALYCAPGNAGTALIAENVPIAVSEIHKLRDWAKEEGIDLTVVGPEAPLAEGIVDVFEAAGLRIFGPSQKAAQLEASKSFAKDVMKAAGVPTAGAEVFEDFELAHAYLAERGAPIVIKADGLAAGKGVTVAMSIEEANSALEECLRDQRFGESGARVVIEDFIDGREASVMAIIDGDSIVPLAISQDYKRLLEKDEGPNTGGMGAISPTPVLNEEKLPELVETVFQPVVSELKSRGIRFRGFLYAGLIIDSDGNYKVLEFNCRLGDPETQVLLPRLKSDLLEAFDAAVSGSLDDIRLGWSEQACACVVASSSGYPKQVDDGKEIKGVFPDRESQLVFQAGTRLDSTGKLTSKGGRILVVTGLGDNLSEALSQAYNGLEEISFDGMHFRKDIGASN